MLSPIMKPFAILLAAFVTVLAPSAVLAKSDKIPPGQAAKAERSEPPGKAKKGDKPEPPSQAKKGPTPPGPDGNGPPGRRTTTDQDEAQGAVDSKQALPLARIVAVAETRSSGHVINARLVRIEGVLLYQLTLLEEGGRSWREYYYARTGNPVVIR